MPPLPAHSVPVASSTARTMALVYTLLLVYASCYPFSGWQDIGLSPLAWMWAPLPRYRTVFDVVANIIAYIPFGILMVLSLYPAVRNMPAVLLAIAAGTLLSGIVETLQTFLPSRVPSNLDLLANAAGVCIGAVSGPALARAILRGGLVPLRRRWFTRDASRGLAVLALWPLAQMYPQAYLFGHGHLVPIMSDWLSQWLAQPVELSVLHLAGAELGPNHYWLLEALITACGLTGTVLTLLCLLQLRAPRTLLVTGLLVATVIAKSSSAALLFAPDHAFAWLTPGAKGGILSGMIMLGFLASAPAIMQRRFAIVALVTGLVAVNAAPVNPYFSIMLQGWTQGQFFNFNGAAQFLSLIWPFFTLGFLLHSRQKLKQK